MAQDFVPLEDRHTLDLNNFLEALFTLARPATKTVISTEIFARDEISEIIVGPALDFKKAKHALKHYTAMH